MSFEGLVKVTSNQTNLQITVSMIHKSADQQKYGRL